MTFDKCKSCGGDLERIGNYYVCKYCGNKWMIDADNDVHVIDRANAWSALRDCDFEHAVELFENIIFKEPENHEAYWGRALAGAGIIYVTDLNENKKVPTCNNISEDSFIEDNYVRKAIALAPKDIAGAYGKQAERIEAIRVEWIKKASKEKPYDVFICFKDSDREHNIDRTDDSYDAHELYNALTEEGYKVFFSRVSLRDKVSEHYEPYIYNALKTAKVMIVFGEKPEYFNAVWVKNEWTRFRAMIERGEKHKNSLVAVYKNITPTELPAGLRSRQCLDASEIKFLEILKQHIEKIINAPQDRTMADDFVPEPPKKKKKWPILAIIAGVLALAITLGVVIPSLTKNRNEETTESIEETTESTKDATGSDPVATERTETETETQGISNETTQTDAGNHDETETKQGETQDRETSAPESPIIENCDYGMTVDPVENTLPSSTSLDVEHIVSGNKYDAASSALNEVVERFYAYDMRLSIYGNYLSITEKVVVTIPLPSDIPADQAVIYYVSDDWIATEIPSTVENGKITFETDHFSIYVVAQRKLPRSTIIFNANGGSGLMENAEVYSSQITTLPSSRFTKTGYTFAGWAHTPSGEIIALDSTNYQVGAETIYNLYAIWVPDTNTVTFDANGGECDIEELTVTFDAEYTLPTPEWAGHIFSGWFLGDNKVEDGVWTNLENITLVAKWDVIVYDITYDLDGGIAENINNYNTDDGATINDPTKVGYTFLGWTYDGQTEPQKNVTIAISTIGDIHFVAHWQANSYEIVFDANGGTCDTTKLNVTFDGEIELPMPTMDGHEFGGWFLDGNKIAVDTWNVAKDVTLVAKWDIITYDIIYDLDAGTASNVNSYDTENGATIADPTKTGYTFLGWTYTGQTEYEKNVVINPGTMGDIEFVAHWQANKYTVTLDANGGECDEIELEVTYDMEYNLPDPEWAGHTFGGWFHDSTMVTSETWSIVSNVTLTAKWDVITYDITYDLDAGTASNVNSYDTENGATIADPTKTGYTFLGWTYTGQTEYEKNVVINPGTMGDIEFVAHWQANKYTVTLDANGGKCDEIKLEVTYDSDYSLPIPEKEGYTFNGWYSGSKQITSGTWKQTNGITVTAKWSANIYTITYKDTTATDAKVSVTFNYNYSGSTATKVTLTNGQILTYPTVPTRSGYAFAGWYVNSSCTVPYDFSDTITEDFTIYAKWIPTTSSYMDIANYTSSNNQKSTGHFYSNSCNYCFTCYKDGTYIIDLTWIDGMYRMNVSNLTNQTTIISNCYVNYESSKHVSRSFTANAGDVICVNFIPSYSGGSSAKFYVSNASYPTSTATVNDIWYKNNSTCSDRIVYGSNCTLITPTRTGYRFEGWYHEDALVQSGEWNIAEDATLIAKWVPKTYTIVYNSGYGIASAESQTVTMGEQTQLATAEREGYEFLGWYYGDTRIESGEWSVAENITLVAKWGLKYTVNHYLQNIDDGEYTLYETEEFVGEENQLITPSVKAHAGFTSPSAQTITLSKDGNLLIEYKYSRDSYILTYVSNGGTSYSVTNHKYDSFLSLETPTKDGKTFGGWFTDIGLTNQFTNTNMPANDVTLYAWWIEETKTNEFTYSGASITGYTGMQNNVAIPSHIGGIAITQIAKLAFAENTTIETVIVPETVTTIATQAFNNCTSLTNIVLSVGLKTVEEQAFFGCTALKNVFYMGSETDWSNISILSNYYLTKAARFYYSKTIIKGNYWHYVDGIPTLWNSEVE